MRLAIIDLGTNTFNLLVADTLSDGQYDILHNSKIPCQLGRGGVHQSVLLDEAIERAMSALREQLDIASKYKVKKVYAFATSAVRSAQNGHLLVARSVSELGLPIHVVSGNEEARLIYLGVRQAVPLTDKPSLIIDIGGGSIEMIICSKTDVFWEKSYPLGMARLLGMFEPSDPITPTEILRLETHFDSLMGDFFEAVSRFSPRTLAGASGSFETFQLMVRNLLYHEPVKQIPICSNLSCADFDRLQSMIIQSTRQQRLEMKGLESSRVDYITLAAIFVHYILRKIPFTTMWVSEFSLKEGVLHSLQQNKIH